ncbi:MAG: hypothetical protein COA47_10100 [Robiginitomaculum sp.]|nr:MAG: hypothetical protein COA47_10100 [Robiginitomaculum sp.]
MSGLAGKLVNDLMIAPKGTNVLSSRVFNYLSEREVDPFGFALEEAGMMVYPPLTESMDLCSELFFETDMDLDIQIKNHTCVIVVGGVSVQTAGKDCIPRAICAIGIKLMELR